jgi:hypothetical protein
MLEGFPLQRAMGFHNIALEGLSPSLTHAKRKAQCNVEEIMTDIYDIVSLIVVPRCLSYIPSSSVRNPAMEVARHHVFGKDSGSV